MSAAISTGYCSSPSPTDSCLADLPLYCIIRSSQPTGVTQVSIQASSACAGTADCTMMEQRAILDADEGRSAGSLIQTMGRAARYVEGHAILYADVAANPALDLDYARQLAARLRVEDLPARALAEAEP